MFIIDPGSIYVAGLADGYYGVAYFSGPVPDTAEDITFNLNHIDGVFFNDNFCGYRTVTTGRASLLNYSDADGLRLILNSDWKEYIPFNRVEELSDGERKFFPKDVRFFKSGEEWSKDTYAGAYFNHTNFGIVSSAMNQFTNAATQDSSYFSMFGPTTAHEVGDYEEITFAQRFALKRLEFQGSAGTSPQNYRFQGSVYGYNYDLEDWVLLLNNYTMYGNAIKQIDAEFETDRYKLEITSKAPSHPVLSKLFFITETPVTYVSEQPTWMMLIPRITSAIQNAERGLPFFWASCSGPTGDGEIKLSKGQFLSGEQIPILTQKFAQEPFWEDV